MCTSKEQVERYEKLLEDMMIDINENGYTCAYLANNSMVVIDETQRPPRAIVCNNHEFQPGCCEAMQAVNFYYERIAAIFAKEEEQTPEPTIRNVIASQNNRVEYQVIGSCKKHYHTVQMVNGRASNCFDHLGAICQHRVYHPAVACSHMRMASDAEEQYRQQLKVEATVQQYNLPDSMQEPFRQVVHEELDKCTEAFRSVMKQPIDEIEGTSDWFKAAEKREKEANKARLKQRKASQERINVFIAQWQETIAA